MAQTEGTGGRVEKSGLGRAAKGATRGAARCRLPLKIPYLALSCMIVALSGCASFSRDADNAFPGWHASPLVETSLGSVAGIKESPGVFAWKGIPYAAPPVGELRWKAPRPAMPWKGTLKAYEFASPPYQRIPVFGHYLGSEDCLYLNIWRPDSSEPGLPVHVWIHGGDNLVGSGDMNPDFLGGRFAAATNSVFVSINYRLGVLGWFSHPALRTGNPDEDSGNFGLLDIIEALKWLRREVANFGGDPSNITISGESSGALNVLALMVSPNALGLFDKAMAQSPYGSPFSQIDATNFADDLIAAFLRRKSYAADLAAAKKMMESTRPGEIAQLLRSADPFELFSLIPLEGVKILSFPYPIWDGAVLPKEKFAALADPSRRNDVPLIIGTTKEEAKVFKWFSGEFPRNLRYQDEGVEASLAWRAEHCDSIADAMGGAAPGNGTSGKVYSYRFDWGALDENGRSVLPQAAAARLGASHGIDMSFFLLSSTVWGNIFPFRIFTKENEPGRTALKEAMARYFSNFMRTGNPNGEGLEYWPSWDQSLESPYFLVLDADTQKTRIHLESGRADPLIAYMNASFGLTGVPWHETLTSLFPAPLTY